MITTTLADTVEETLGDPFDATNPHGFHALVDTAEGRRPFDATPWHLPDGDPESVLHALRALHRRSPALAPAPPAGAPAATVVGASVGALDSALRITLRHLRSRHLYGAPASDLPALRTLLAGAYADLLLCDTLATLAVRGTEPLPDRPGALAHAAEALAPRALQGAMDRLSVVMGSRFYIREGAHSSFQRLLYETQRALFGADRPVLDPEPVPLAALLAAPAVVESADPILLAAAPGLALTGSSRRVPQPGGAVQERLYEELVARYEAGTTFDHTRRPLPDRP
ncbi:acyl-CoA dehydrogenase family protein [Streptomyces zaomyceticus]|uniref:Acyl-CoA dehydrogenase family protein n=1 Tax=Streptomyces zaomyceticus TaxID=68286 RepID=A0ABZ1L5Q7_9ACTN|nr:acyl-CoA dehydrogenase family protein [Streptomyces zaomyceticus]